jgi:gas vesicle protein
MTAPLFALVGVVVGGVIAGTVTLIATGRQLRAQTSRELMLIRQKWIEKLRERVPEIVSTAGLFYLSQMKNAALNASEEASQTLKLAQQIIEIELMLDLNDETHVALRQAIEDVRKCAFSSGMELIQFEKATQILTQRCAVVLNKEVSALK